MDLSLTTIDNITELLVKILEFTQRRHQILMQNIVDINLCGFVPKDLDVDNFADLMSQAISEHLRSRRLLLCDSETTKFGVDGSFESLPVTDEHAKYLLENDKTKYMEFQIEKLSENMLNSKIAAKLLGQKHSRV